LRRFHCIIIMTRTRNSTYFEMLTYIKIPRLVTHTAVVFEQLTKYFFISIKKVDISLPILSLRYTVNEHLVEIVQGFKMKRNYVWH
jgi:hypothetical protein